MNMVACMSWTRQPGFAGKEGPLLILRNPSLAYLRLTAGLQLAVQIKLVNGSVDCSLLSAFRSLQVNIISRQGISKTLPLPCRTSSNVLAWFAGIGTQSMFLPP